MVPRVWGGVRNLTVAVVDSYEARCPKLIARLTARLAARIALVAVAVLLLFALGGE